MEPQTLGGHLPFLANSECAHYEKAANGSNEEKGKREDVGVGKDENN